MAALVAAGHQDFHKSLAAGDADRARMLLRLFAALTAVNVLQPGSLLTALQSLASTALAVVETGGQLAAANPAFSADRSAAFSNHTVRSFIVLLLVQQSSYANWLCAAEDTLQLRSWGGACCSSAAVWGRAGGQAAHGPALGPSNSTGSALPRLNSYATVERAHMNALPCAAAGGEHAAALQPYGDTLVAMLLMALPWASDTLVRSSTEPKLQLLGSVQRYMDARPFSSSPAFRPFAAGGDESDVAARSDSGSASYLTEVRAFIMLTLSVHQPAPSVLKDHCTDTRPHSSGPAFGPFAAGGDESDAAAQSDSGSASSLRVSPIQPQVDCSLLIQSGVEHINAGGAGELGLDTAAQVAQSG